MKKGDIIKVSYSGKFEEGLIETTDEAVAKKENAYNKDRQYQPAIVVVGEGQVLPGLDKALEGLDVGKSKKLNLTPKDAFGERSFKLIQLVPMRQFKQQKVNPFPGMVLEIEGRPAKIQSVSSGRVRVDFNHPLAGKDVEYDLKIEAAATTEKEKITFLIERAFKEELKFTITGAKDKKKVTIDIPEALTKNKYYQVMKAVIKVEIDRYLGIKEVEYNEPGAKAEKKPVKKK